MKKALVVAFLLLLVSRLLWQEEEKRTFVKARVTAYCPCNK